MANNFSADSNCVAVYRMESGALTTDSKGTNTLTDYNTVAEDTTNYAEGTCSAGFVYANVERLYRTDSNLSSNFPLKSGTSNTSFTICHWHRFSATGYNATPWGKFGATSSNYYGSVLSFPSTHTTITLWIGDGGTTIRSTGTLNITDFVSGQWYHVAVSYDDSDTSYHIRTYGLTEAASMGDLTGTFGYNIALGTHDFSIGCYGASSNRMTGNIDELVVFNDVLTSDEIDQIRAGTYGAAAGVSIPVFMHHYMHH